MAGSTGWGGRGVPTRLLMWLPGSGGVWADRLFLGALHAIGRA
jgi:hypothetical protein